MKEEIQKYIIEVLQILTEKIPPGKDSHSIQLHETGRFALQIFIEGRCQSIVLHEDYGDITPTQFCNGLFLELNTVGYKTLKLIEGLG